MHNALGTIPRGRLGFLGFFVLAAFVVQGCGSDDDGNGGTPTPTATATRTSTPTPTPTPIIESCLFTLVNPDPPDPVQVASFSRDVETGRLTLVGRFETGGLGDSFTGGTNQGSIVAQGMRLFAVSPGPNDDYEGTANEGQGSVTAFDINEDCSLDATGIAPSGGKLPVSLTVHDDLLYVANQGNVPLIPPLEQASYSGLRVGSNGSLTPIAGSTVLIDPIEPAGNNPGDILFNADGSLLVGIRLTGNGIDTFRINAQGLPTDHKMITTGGGPFGSSFSPSDPSLLLVTHAEPLLNMDGVPALSRAPGLASFRLAEDGTLGFLDASTHAGDPDVVDPCWTAITSDGRYIWTGSFLPRAVNAFSIAEDGEVERLSAYNPGDMNEATGKILGLIDIAISPDDRFLYQLRAFDIDFILDEENAVFIIPEISVLRLTGDYDVDAGVELVESVRLPADQDDDGSMGLVIVDLN